MVLLWDSRHAAGSHRTMAPSGPSADGHVRHIGERHRLPCRRVFWGQAPMGRDPIVGVVCGLGVEQLPAAGAEAIVPAVPAAERLITAQAGGGAGVGHTWSRGLVHRCSLHAGADAIKIKIDNYC